MLQAPSSLLNRCETFIKMGGLVPDESRDNRSNKAPLRPAVSLFSPNHLIHPCTQFYFCFGYFCLFELTLNNNIRDITHS